LTLLFRAGITLGQPADLSFRRYTAGDGLSNPTVNAIAQDSSGFMWFGTADGLNRFDGYSFTLYKHRSGDSTSLGSSEIRSLVCDRNGILWIATGAGLDRYDRGAARFIREGGSGNDTSGLHRPGIATLVLGADMAMWIGTKGRGLLRLDTRSGAVKTFRHDPSNVQSLAGDSISCVYPASDGRIWVSYDGGGLSIFNERASVFSNFFTEVPDDSRGTDIGPANLNGGPVGQTGTDKNVCPTRRLTIINASRIPDS